MAMRPPMPSVVLSRRAKIALTVAGILIVLLILLARLAGVYVNVLWFREVGASQVYSTAFWTRTVLFVVFGLLMAAVIAGNLIAAYVSRPPFRPMSPEQQSLQNYVLMIEPRRRLVLVAVTLLSFLAAGAAQQGNWATWQLFFNGGSFGAKDPQFGKDVSFYAWDLPVYRLLLGFGFTAVIFALLMSIAVHYLTGAIRLQTPGPKITISARRHLTVVVFVFMLLKAAAYWLDRYSLVFSERSKFTGASYTDVHSALPAKTILFWITLILAVAIFASLWLRSALIPGIGFVVLMVLSILIGGIYPSVVQSVSVAPNASDKERPYIGRNIAATRAAYDIVTKDAKHPDGTVTYKPYNADSSPKPTSLSSTNTTVDNIRILDPNVVSPTFTNAQKIQVPYGFASKLDVDRYKVPGPRGTTLEHDYVVGVREQLPANLTGPLDNWINQHTVYTHGYGFVAAQADLNITDEKIASYTERDIPPVGPLGLKIPAVYYGQVLSDFSIVGAKGVTPREYDGNGTTNVTYKGTGGVPLDSFLNRLAFATDYQDTNFILNDAVSAPGSRVIFNRDPKKRVEKVAPFLTVDGDPYPFVDKTSGHVVWMVDGYTTMSNFPYSERKSLSELTGTSLRQGQKDTQINYIRNSVKATVDAFDGTVRLYRWDTKDPILTAWTKVFPGLFKSTKDMPASVKDHIRYPQDLFNVQRGLLTQYHIDNPVSLYNGNGKWSVPADPFATGGLLQPPYYVLANSPAQPSSTTPQFQLTTPMVVNGATNLAAYISANSDYTNYGQMTVLTVPKKSAIKGPSQVANDFKSDAVISADITLFGSQSGQSEVLHGNLLTLPVGDSFLYVEPLYVQSSSSSAFPTLQRVLVRFGDKLGYGATLSDALADVVLDRRAGSSLKQIGQTTTPTTTPSTTPSTSPTTSPSSTSPSAGTPSTAPSSSAPLPASVNAALAQLDTAYSDLQNAYSSGDPAKIGAAEIKVQQLVKQLVALHAKTPTR